MLLSQSVFLTVVTMTVVEVWGVARTSARSSGISSAATADCEAVLRAAVDVIDPATACVPDEAVLGAAVDGTDPDCVSDEAVAGAAADAVDPPTACAPDAAAKAASCGAAGAVDPCAVV